MSYFKSCSVCVPVAGRYARVGDTIEIVLPEYCQNGSHRETVEKEIHTRRDWNESLGQFPGIGD